MLTEQGDRKGTDRETEAGHDGMEGDRWKETDGRRQINRDRERQDNTKKEQLPSCVAEAYAQVRGHDALPSLRPPPLCLLPWGS